MDGYVASLPSTQCALELEPCVQGVDQLENLAYAQTGDELHEDKSRMASGLQVQDWPIVKSCEVLGQNSSQLYSTTTNTNNNYTNRVNNSLTKEIRKYVCGSPTEHNHY